MEQKPSLEDLVEKVDAEASKFASFDEFLESSEWKKPASDAVDSSSSSSEESVAETADSSQPTSVEIVTDPANEARKAAMSKPDYIPNGLKSEKLSHPLAPSDAIHPEEPAPPVQEAAEIETIYKIETIPWPGHVQQILTEIEQVRENEPEWWRVRFLAGRSFATNAATIPAIIEHIHKLDEVVHQIKRFQHGAKTVIAERLQKSSKTDREAAAKFDKEYRQRANTKTADKMKSDRAPKPGIGIVTAKALIASQAYDKDEIIGMLRSKGKMDDATMAFIEKECGK